MTRRPRKVLICGCYAKSEFAPHRPGTIAGFSAQLVVRQGGRSRNRGRERCYSARGAALVAAHRDRADSALPAKKGVAHPFVAVIEAHDVRAGLHRSPADTLRSSGPWTVSAEPDFGSIGHLSTSFCQGFLGRIEVSELDPPAVVGVGSSSQTSAVITECTVMAMYSGDGDTAVRTPIFVCAVRHRGFTRCVAGGSPRYRLRDGRARSLRRRKRCDWSRGAHASPLLWWTP